jgi:small subunit ribosomal protein S17
MSDDLTTEGQPEESPAMPGDAATQAEEPAMAGPGDESQSVPEAGDGPGIGDGAPIEAGAEVPAPQSGSKVSVAPPGASGRGNRRKIREGLVLSVQMDKTAVVGVIERVRHARYAKTVQRTKRLYVHDEANDVRVGDRVRVAETRPISKLKRWRLVEVLERAK